MYKMYKYLIKVSSNTFCFFSPSLRVGFMGGGLPTKKIQKLKLK